MLFPQGIEEEEETWVNIRTIINIGIRNSHKIIKEMHPLQEAEEEVQVSSEEEAEKDLMEEEEAKMDLEKDKDHNVIIVINLVILKKIVLQNCEIWNIKLPIQLLKKQGMRSYSSQVLWHIMKKAKLGIYFRVVQLI
jgi:hypothetical protein